jgi:hypothetical protein
LFLFTYQRCQFTIKNNIQLNSRVTCARPMNPAQPFSRQKHFWTFTSLIYGSMIPSQPWTIEQLPHKIHIIVESDFFMSQDVAFRDENHPKPLAYDPLLDLAIRVTRMVRKTCDAALYSSIDVLFDCRYLSRGGGVWCLPRLSAIPSYKYVYYACRSCIFSTDSQLVDH